MSEPLLIQSSPLNGVLFGLRFSRLEDRYVHQVFASDTTTNEDLLLISSVDGSPDDAWPPSPPLQDVHQQSIGNLPVIMAVGMAGGAHWSAACSLEQPSSQSLRFHFDLACRTNGPAGWLGSTYLNSIPFDLHGSMESSRPAILSNFSIQLSPLDVDGQSCNLSQQPEKLLLKAPVSPTENTGTTPLKTKSQTIRWQYELAIRLN